VDRSALTTVCGPLLEARGDLARLFGDAGVLEAARVRVDGLELVVVFQLSYDEHARRLSRGVGAVVSTGLLHGLWLLPSGLPVRREEVPEVKARRLEVAVGLVDVVGGSFVRTYEPVGKVVGIAACGADPRRVLRQATRQSPVFGRAAVLQRRPSRGVAQLVSSCVAAGVGLAVDDRSGLEVMVPVPAPVVGVPGVLRWWLAELAYEAWLQERVQLVS
jgi:hypothetical protein